MPQTPEQIRLIFTHAILGKADDRVVHVEALDLIDSLGEATARDVSGQQLDKKAIEKQLAELTDKRKQEARDEVAKAKQMVDAGFTNAVNILTQAQKRLTAVETGTWKPSRLVAVPCGRLRAALENPAPSTAANRGKMTT